MLVTSGVWCARRSTAAKSGWHAQAPNRAAIKPNRPSDRTGSFIFAPNVFPRTAITAGDARLAKGCGERGILPTIRAHEASATCVVEVSIHTHFLSMAT